MHTRYFVSIIYNAPIVYDRNHRRIGEYSFRLSTHAQTCRGPVGIPKCTYYEYYICVRVFVCTSRGRRLYYLAAVEAAATAVEGESVLVELAVTGLCSVYSSTRCLVNCLDGGHRCWEPFCSSRMYGIFEHSSVKRCGGG